MNTKLSEKYLDKAIDDAFKNSVAFTNWFLSKTKFADQNASYIWSRSDHPWCRMKILIQDIETGLEREEERDCETDILVVFETENKTRFALHIENKLADGHFTQYQPEMYAQRAALWQGQDKWQNYSDFETILIAPTVFFEKNKASAEVFDRFISYEEIAEFIPQFKP